MWFLDHNYVESMNDMFKKVNAREKLIGWYHSGPKLRASDLEINELFKRYTPNPLLVIIDVQPKEVGVPTDAYFAVEEIKDVCVMCPLYTRGTNIHTLILGRHYDHKDLCTYTFHNRGGRGRRDRCRTPSQRYPRCRCWHTLNPHNLPTTIITRSTSSITGHRPVSTESPRR